MVQFDTPDVVELLEEGLRAIGRSDSILRARLLCRLAIAYLFDPDPQRRTEHALEGEAVARRIGDPGTLCRALQIWSFTTPLSTDPQVALARSTEMVNLAEEANITDFQLSAVSFRTMSLISALETATLAREVEKFQQLAWQAREPAHLWLCATCRAVIALAVGPLDEAQRLIDQAREIGQRSEHPLDLLFGPAQQYVLENLRGPPGPGTEAMLAFWETPLGESLQLGAPKAATLIALGRIEEAREAFEGSAQQRFADIPRDANWLGRVLNAAQSCVQLGDAPRAELLYDLLLPYVDLVGFTGPASICYGPVALNLGRLASLIGRTEGRRERHDQAVAHFELALEKIERLEFRVFGATARIDFARALVARDAPSDRERALGLLGEALDLAEELGMKPAVEAALVLKLELQGAESSGVKRSIYVVADAVETQRPDLGHHAAPDGTVTLLFSDMEGFTSMTERLGDLRAREVIRDHNRIVREQLSAHGGYEVELQGDGFLLAFGSARQGLLCAVAIQSAFAEHSERNPGEPIRVRIGVHTGEALRDADKFFGKTVILAARIAAEARGGEILASAIVRELTASSGDLHFGVEREARLKGISTPQRLVLLDW